VILNLYPVRTSVKAARRPLMARIVGFQPFEEWELWEKADSIRAAENRQIVTLLEDAAPASTPIMRGLSVNHVALTVMVAFRHKQSLRRSVRLGTCDRSGRA
jgi:hypothetical protein